MAYTYIADPHGAYVHSDHKAAEANVTHAIWSANDARKRGDTTALAAAQAAYAHYKAILEDIRPHVNVAGGHTPLPESI